jgi:MinD superfamily P-loop ATPase
LNIAFTEKVVPADCDVDAADLHLVLEPKIKQTHDFSGGKQASIIAEKCTGCSICRDMCRFGANRKQGENNHANLRI